MDNHVASIIIEKLEALSARIDEIDGKFAAFDQIQNMHGEIYVETAKVLQNMQMQSKSALDGLFELVGSLANREEGPSRADLAALSSLISKDIPQRSVDLNSIKQSTNLALRNAHHAHFPIRCVFLVHSIPMWDALGDVHAAMLEDPRFDPIVISVRSTALGYGPFKGEDIVSEELTGLGVKHLRFDMEDSYEGLDILKALAPAVIFRQQQWDSCLPPAFRTPELTFARLCLVPYALNLASSLGDPVTTEVSAFGFDQAYHQLAWRVFCETKITQSYFRSFNHSDPEKFILSGYPKFDRLMKAGSTGSWPIASRGKKAFRVIWAPHYSIGKGGIGFGVFDQIWESMIKWAREQQDIDIVLKPHPALFGQVLQGEGLDMFKTTWNALPNCTIEMQQYGELFAESDLMISDGLSFLAEYQLFKKPIIFFDSGKHVPFNALGKMAEAATRRVRTFEEMKKATLEYKNGKAWAFEQQREALLDTLLPNQGKAASSILDAIASGIQAEQATFVQP